MVGIKHLPWGKFTPPHPNTALVSSPSMDAGQLIIKAHILFTYQCYHSLLKLCRPPVRNLTNNSSSSRQFTAKLHSGHAVTPIDLLLHMCCLSLLDLQPGNTSALSNGPKEQTKHKHIRRPSTRIRHLDHSKKGVVPFSGSSAGTSSSPAVSREIDPIGPARAGRAAGGARNKGR